MTSLTTYNGNNLDRTIPFTRDAYIHITDDDYRPLPWEKEMNLNLRRPLSSTPKKHNNPTKQDVIDACAEEGRQFAVMTVDKGQWNERRIFMSGDDEMDVVFKGDKPDWGQMLVWLGHGERWGL